MTNADDSLIEGYLENDMAKMQDALNNGANGDYLVNTAAADGNLPIVSLLINAGCLPESPSNDETPGAAMALLSSGVSDSELALHGEIIDKLIMLDPAKGIIIHGEEGSSSLASVCMERGLIAHACRISGEYEDLVNARYGEDGNTIVGLLAASSFCSEEDKINLATDLFRNGASTKAKNNNGVSASQIAKETGMEKFAEFLSNMSNVSHHQIVEKLNSMEGANKPKILIVGMLAKQFEILKASIGNEAKLELVTSEGLDASRLVDKAKNSDEVVVMTAFVSHSHVHLISKALTEKKKKHIPIYGGVETVTEATKAAIASFKLAQLCQPSQSPMIARKR